MWMNKKVIYIQDWLRTVVCYFQGEVPEGAWDRKRRYGQFRDTAQIQMRPYTHGADASQIISTAE